jgi:hypothetical protein
LEQSLTMLLWREGLPGPNVIKLFTTVIYDCL